MILVVNTLSSCLVSAQQLSSVTCMFLKTGLRSSEAESLIEGSADDPGFQGFVRQDRYIAPLGRFWQERTGHGECLHSAVVSHIGHWLSPTRQGLNATGSRKHQRNIF